MQVRRFIAVFAIIRRARLNVLRFSQYFLMISPTGSALLLTNAESTAKVAARVAANTSLSAAAGTMSSMLVNMFHNKNDNDEYSLSLEATMNGALSGLVAITGACGTVELWAAVLIGAIGGWIYVHGNTLLLHWRVDDVVQGIPVHFFCGMWSTLATGFFSSPSAVRGIWHRRARRVVLRAGTRHVRCNSTDELANSLACHHWMDRLSDGSIFLLAELHELATNGKA